MSNLTSADNTHLRVLKFARRLYCLPLPEGFLPPREAEALATLVTHVGDALGIEQLTPKVVHLGSAQWMMIFFHGPERLRRLSTYEAGQPRSLSYSPREMAMVVVDGQHHLMYVSMSQHRKSLRLFLSALNGTLFPERPSAAPFESFRFNLDILPALQLVDRHPQGDGLPWQHLTLKSIVSQDPGRDLAWSTRKWGRDGFEELAQQAFSWPRHLCEVGLAIQAIDAKKTFSVHLFQGQNFLRAALVTKHLSALAGVVNLCSNNGENRMWVE